MCLKFYLIFILISTLLQNSLIYTAKWRQLLKPVVKGHSWRRTSVKMINRSLVLTYLCLLIYIMLSSGVILYNKWVLSPKCFNFAFPITLTMIQMGFSGAVAFFLVHVFKVVSPVKMTFGIYVTCVIPISAFFASSLCMVLVSIGMVISSYGEIHFNVIGTFYQVTGIFAEALRLVLTQVLLQKKGLTLNPITSLYYIAPCSFVFLFVPWYFLENPGMEVPQIQFNFWIFFSNTICVLLLNFSIFLVIGRTGAVTVRVAGVLKDWIVIALSMMVFPESTITRLNIIGYAIALCGVVLYNYLKVKDARASQTPESISERITKEWKLEKKSSDVYTPDSSNDDGGGGSSGSDFLIDEEAPLIPSSRLSQIGRTQQNPHNA